MDGVFINLARAVDRRAAMERQLENTPLPYPVLRFDAVDGTQRQGRPAALTAGQYGCWLSHLEVIEHAGERGGHLHVMEDDALLSENVTALPDLLEVVEAGSQGEWDLLYLDATLPEIGDMVLMFEWTQLAREQGHVQLHAVPEGFKLFGTHSYVVNGARRDRVAEFLRRHLASGAPIDNVLASGVRSGALKAHITAPFITSSSDVGLQRTIGAETDDRFVAWFLHRRLCFAELSDETLAELEQRLPALLPRVGRAERLLGALLAYRVARWPRVRFGADMS